MAVSSQEREKEFRQKLKEFLEENKAEIYINTYYFGNSSNSVIGIHLYTIFDDMGNILQEHCKFDL